MIARFSHLRIPIQHLWQSIPLSQRVTLAAVFIAIAAAITTLTGWASSPDYEPVFSNISADKAAKLADQFRAEGISFRLSNDGKTFFVPAAQADQARLKALSAGVTGHSDQAGFELFDQSGFGMTDQLQRINYQRALEGELARSINKIEGVEEARVHLVIPVPSLFTERRGEPSASVLLLPRGARMLDEERIQSVVSLVMAGVEGLKAENISVVDTKGRVLNSLANRAGTEGGGRAPSSQYQQQLRFEADLGGSLMRVLERIVGAGNAAVKVAATLDWDQVEKQREIYEPLPTPGAIRSIREQSESSTNGAVSAGGVPGVASNVPSYQSSSTGASGSGAQESQRRDSTTNFEMNKTVERTVRTPGAVKRLSVMAVVDESSLPDNVDMAQLERLLSTAAQLDTSRGDSVAVSKMPFNSAQVDAEMNVAKEATFREDLLSTARSVAFALVPLFLVFMGYRALRSSLPVAAEMTAPVVRLQNLPELEPPRPSAEELKARAVQQQIVSLAKQEPRVISALIGTLMDDGRR